MSAPNLCSCGQYVLPTAQFCDHCGETNFQYQEQSVMPEKKQIQHLADEVDSLIDRYRAEYDMTYASVVGVLNMKIHNLCQEAVQRHQEGEE